jgi:hypothetical protein
MLIAQTVTLESIPDLAGRSFTSPYIVVDDLLRTQFEQATMIEEFLAEEDRSLYPAGMLEGFHLLGLLDHFISKYIDWDPSTYGLNYGLDRVRFVDPMVTGRPLRLRATVTRVAPKHDGYVIHFDCVLEHEGADRPGVIATWLCYQLPQSVAGGQ